MSLNRSALGGAKDPAVGGRLTTNTRILSSGFIGWYQRATSLLSGILRISWLESDLNSPSAVLSSL